MIARDIMTENPICVEESDDITTVANKLFEQDIRHLPVLKDNELVGMISDKDLQGYQLSVFNQLTDDFEVNHFDDVMAKDLMNSDVIYVNSETEIQEMIDLIIDNKVGALPVVEASSNTLCGIVSYIDILKAAKEFL